VLLWYTSDPDVDPSPVAPSNEPGGSTVWCDAAVDGQPVYRANVTTSSAECPQSPAEVTAVRARAYYENDSIEVPFPNGARLTLTVTMLPTSNSAGDVYYNRAMGRAIVDGLTQPVGPRGAAATVIASSVGDRVWVDANGNGIQDPGETEGAADLPVTLDGIDSDGNVVHVTTTTDQDGYYIFEDLQSGTYHVTFDPDGRQFTLQSRGDDRQADSDGNPTTGQTADFTLGMDQDRVDIDQGVRAPVSLFIEKRAEATDGTWPGLCGSTWEVRDDDIADVDNPVPGAPAAGVSYTQVAFETCDAGSAAVWEIGNLAPGTTYWLVETKAPSGFSLLATAAQFTVNADGSVTPGLNMSLDDPGAVVSVAPGPSGPPRDGAWVITVRDVPNMVLPYVGGPGMGQFYRLGIAALLLVVGYFTTGWGHRRRVRRKELLL
jgi:hypothetical protein